MIDGTHTGEIESLQQTTSGSFFVGDVAEIFEAAKCHLFKP